MLRVSSPALYRPDCCRIPNHKPPYRRRHAALNDLHQARTGAFGPAPALRQDDEVHLRQSRSLRTNPPGRLPPGAGGTIEIVFANGTQLRITGAVDLATLTAAMAC
jgi:hypothetical protein